MSIGGFSIPLLGCYAGIPLDPLSDSCSIGTRGEWVGVARGGSINQQLELFHQVERHAGRCQT